MGECGKTVKVDLGAALLTVSCSEQGSHTEHHFEFYIPEVNPLVRHNIFGESED